MASPELDRAIAMCRADKAETQVVKGGVKVDHAGGLTS